MQRGSKLAGGRKEVLGWVVKAQIREWIEESKKKEKPMVSFPMVYPRELEICLNAE